jgi:hypothetical protein
VQVEDDITFDSPGEMSTGFAHSAGSAQIMLVHSGTYKITFSVAGTEPNQMALFIDGVLVPGSVYGSGAGTQQNTGLAIVTVSTDGALLTLRNHSSASAVGLASVIGGTQENVNASVAIEKVA